MADNVPITPGSGITIATDDVGGRHHQLVKPVWGVDGTATPVSETNPLPVGLSVEAMDALHAAAPPLTENGQLPVVMVDSNGDPIPIASTNWDDGLQPSESYMGKTGTAATVVSFDLTTDTAAYADGDVLFDFQATPTVGRITGGMILIQGITIYDRDDVGTPMDIFVSPTAVTLGTENLQPSISDVDIVSIKRLCRVENGDYIDLGGAKMATRTGLGLLVQLEPGSQIIYVGGIIRGTGTFTATGLRAKLDVIQL